MSKLLYEITKNTLVAFDTESFGGVGAVGQGPYDRASARAKQHASDQTEAHAYTH